MRKELTAGILLFSLAALLSLVDGVPHFILGLLMGGAIFLELLGAVPRPVLKRLKERKKQLFRMR